MRVPQVGPAQAGRKLGKAVQKAGARLRVVPGAFAHTKEVTGLTRLNEVVGRWIQIPPAYYLFGELRSKEPAWGQVSFVS